ncbi:MAG: hypothetical protein NC405_00520 [Odoribacter sp.]|nr:hypothetical protein [Odoribacter sp.]
MPKNDENATRRLFMSQWLMWAVTMLSFAVVLVLPFFISKTWLPLPVALFAYTLLVYSRRISNADNPGCVLILRYGMSVLIWTAIVMETINILNSRMLLDGLIDWSNSNREIPYITCLILSPVMVLVALWQLIMSGRTRFCDNCRARNGYVYGSNVVSRIYENESRYQLQLILLVSIAMAAVQWWYYAAYYININMNRPDRFFFNLMPVVIYLFMIFFMLTRYTNMSRIIGPLTACDGRDYSVVRYLVLAGDCLLLSKGTDGRWDTPATADVNPREFLSQADAAREFASISGIEGTDLKFLFTNKSHDNSTEIIHYAAFLEGDCNEAASGRLSGQWLTLDMLDRMLKSAQLSAELANEIYRIFTITMAWKTYRPDGKRRYPIKRYRPTFRLRDLRNWNVDYDDMHWFNVANNNEDRRFFKTRRLWQRLTGQTVR